jgi:hypothetical protein
MTPDSLTARLMYQFAFSADNLAANRAGRLTDDQRGRARTLWRETVRRRELDYLAAWVVVSVALLGWSALRGEFGLTIALIVGVALVFVTSALLRRYNARDLRSGMISAAEGEAAMRMYTLGTRAGRVMNYELDIGERSFFRDNEAELVAFERGCFYRVYYIRYAPAHMILSAEALDS